VKKTEKKVEKKADKAEKKTEKAVEKPEKVMLTPRYSYALTAVPRVCSAPCADLRTGCALHALRRARLLPSLLPRSFNRVELTGPQETKAKTTKKKETPAAA